MSVNITSLLEKGLGDAYCRILEAPKDSLTDILIECILRDKRWNYQLDNRTSYYEVILKNLDFDYKLLLEKLISHENENKKCKSDLTLSLIIKRYLYESDISCLDLLSLYLDEGQDKIALVKSLVKYYSDDFNRKKDPKSKKFKQMIVKVICENISNKAINEDLNELLLAREECIDEVKDSKEIKDYCCKNVKENNLSQQSLNKDITFKEAFSEINNKSFYSITRLLFKTNKKKEYFLSLNDINKNKTKTLKQEILILLTNQYLGKSMDDRYFIDLFKENQSSIYDNCLLSYFLDLVCDIKDERVINEILSWIHHSKRSYRLICITLSKSHLDKLNILSIKKQISTSIDNDEMYDALDLLDLLVRMDPNLWWSEFDDLYLKCTYSYGRTMLIEAMIFSDFKKFSQKYAFACLWDCEQITIKLAIPYVELKDKRVVKRLEQLSVDPEISGYDESLSCLARRRYKIAKKYL